MKAVVVTGTDTEVGKTMATAALALTLNCSVVKIAQTGLADGEIGDAQLVGGLTGRPAHEFVRLQDPLSPRTAARRENVRLPTVRDHALRIADLNAETVIVEGSGGLLVELDGDGATLADLGREMVDVGVEVHFVIVVRAGLGTLNHTLLTVRTLFAAGLEPSALLIGSWPRRPNLAEQCNLEDLPRVAGVPLLGRLPESVEQSAAALDAASALWDRDVLGLI